MPDHGLTDSLPASIRYDRPIDLRPLECFNHRVGGNRPETRRALGTQATDAIAPLRTRLVCMTLPALLAAVTGCSSGKAATPAPPPAVVEVAEVVQRDTPIYSEWVGVLDGFVNAQIQPHVSGYIIRQ